VFVQTLNYLSSYWKSYLLQKIFQHLDNEFDKAPWCVDQDHRYQHKVNTTPPLSHSNILRCTSWLVTLSQPTMIHTSCWWHCSKQNTNWDYFIVRSKAISYTVFSLIKRTQSLKPLNRSSPNTPFCTPVSWSWEDWRGNVCKQLAQGCYPVE